MTTSLTLALLNAQSGLIANQEALGVTGNNVANANTDGYSRKIANFETRRLAGVGAGVQVSEISRRVDEGLLRSLRKEKSYFKSIDVKQSFFERIQSLYGQPSDNNSIAHLLEGVSESFESLALAPDRSPEQGDVVRQLRRFGVRMREMSQSLQDLRAEADKQISEIADRVTFLLEEISNINAKIVRNDAISHDITDLLDQRDIAVDEISEYMDIEYYLRNGTEMIIFTPGGSTLLDVSPRSLTHASGGRINQTVTHAGGSIGPLFLSGSNEDITNQIRSGKLKGLIDLRDSILPDMQSELDELSAALRDELNLINNRNAPFPGLEKAEGTRHFIDPANQTIQLAGTGDVVIAITDRAGDQEAVTTLNALMVDAGFTDHGNWTINDVTATIQDWLQSEIGTNPTVSIIDGKVTIDMNSANHHLVFQDEAPGDGETVGQGASRADVTINFNSDGDANNIIDERIRGFSNFFGLNDLIVDPLEHDRYDSEVKPADFTWQPTGAVTLSFSFNDGTGMQTETVSLFSHTAYSLQDIADVINHHELGISFITAHVIPDGNGGRLRLDHDGGRSFVITDNFGTGAVNSFLDNLNMKKSDTRSAEFFNVRPDIFSQPSLLSRSALVWDPKRGASGEYFIGRGDNTAATEISAALIGTREFETAGSVYVKNTSFTKYAEHLVSENALHAANNKTTWEDVRQLTQALEERSDSHRGVNLDEEMSNLILFQHAYSAAARVIGIVDEMFDALQAAV